MPGAFTQLYAHVRTGRARHTPSVVYMLRYGADRYCGRRAGPPRLLVRFYFSTCSMGPWASCLWRSNRWMPLVAVPSEASGSSPHECRVCELGSRVRCRHDQRAQTCPPPITRSWHSLPGMCGWARSWVGRYELALTTCCAWARCSTVVQGGVTSVRVGTATSRCDVGAAGAKVAHSSHGCRRRAGSGGLGYGVSFRLGGIFRFVFFGRRRRRHVWQRHCAAAHAAVDYVNCERAAGGGECGHT